MNQSRRFEAVRVSPLMPWKWRKRIFNQFAFGARSFHRSSSHEVTATCPALGAFLNPLLAMMFLARRCAIA
jgi:hypothetical protein